MCVYMSVCIHIFLLLKYKGFLPDWHKMCFLMTAHGHFSNIKLSCHNMWSTLIFGTYAFWCGAWLSVKNCKKLLFYFVYYKWIDRAKSIERMLVLASNEMMILSLYIKHFMEFKCKGKHTVHLILLKNKNNPSVITIEIDTSQTSKYENK